MHNTSIDGSYFLKILKQYIKKVNIIGSITARVLSVLVHSKFDWKYIFENFYFK